MSLPLNKLRLLLRARLLTVGGLPVEARRAWENQAFDTPAANDGVVWIREKLLMASERRTSTGYDQALGEYRIDLFCPANKGTKDVEDLSTLIKETFKAGTLLSNASVSANIYRSERLTGRVDPGNAPVWYMLPVVVSFRSHTPV